MRRFFALFNPKSIRLNLLFSGPRLNTKGSQLAKMLQPPVSAGAGENSGLRVNSRSVELQRVDSLRKEGLRAVEHWSCDCLGGLCKSRVTQVRLGA